jgi:hypothetical protein
MDASDGEGPQRLATTGRPCVFIHPRLAASCGEKYSREASHLLAMGARQQKTSRSYADGLVPGPGSGYRQDMWSSCDLIWERLWYFSCNAALCLQGLHSWDATNTAVWGDGVLPAMKGTERCCVSFSLCLQKREIEWRRCVFAGQRKAIYCEMDRTRCECAEYGAFTIDRCFLQRRTAFGSPSSGRKRALRYRKRVLCSGPSARSARRH